MIFFIGLEGWDHLHFLVYAHLAFNLRVASSMAFPVESEGYCQ